MRGSESGRPSQTKRSKIHVSNSFIHIIVLISLKNTAFVICCLLFAMLKDACSSDYLIFMAQNCTAE